MTNRSGSLTRTRARATPKPVSRGGPSLANVNANIVVHRPKSASQPHRVPSKDVHRLVVSSYIPRPRHQGPVRENTARHWVLHLSAEARRDRRGLLHDIAGHPGAFYQRRLRDVRSSELGDDVRDLAAGTIHDVVAYDEIVSTTRVVNEHSDFNSQHWAHEAVERLHDRGLLYDVDWEALECVLIRNLEDVS